MQTPLKKYRSVEREDGFTLVELMIVVVIIGILAAIAIPQFTSFQLRAKHNEAPTVLGGLHSALEPYISKWGVYLEMGQMPLGLRGIVPTGGKTSWLPVGQTCRTIYPPPAIQGGSCAFGYAPQGRVFLTYTITAGDGIGASTPFPLGSAVGDGLLGGALGTDADGYPCGHAAVHPGCVGHVGTVPIRETLVDVTFQATGDVDNDGVFGQYYSTDQVRTPLPSPVAYGATVF